MRSDVGINPQSLSYWFLNEIIDHPCLDGGLEVIGSNIPNLMNTKFCEGCTKSFKVRFEVGINLQSFSYRFLNEIMDHPCSDGGPGSNRIKCTKFNERCTKFCEGCVKSLRWGFASCYVTSR